MHRWFRSVFACAAMAMVFLSWVACADGQATVKFNLPAQSLDESLRAVASRTGTNILFDRALVRGLAAQALNAELSFDQAVSRLLVGTGLTYHKTDEKTVVIVPAAKAVDPAATRDLASPTTPKTAERFEVAALQGARRADSTEYDEGPKLEEIMVTARRREESLNSVPVAVTALSAEELRSMSIQT